MLLYPNRLALLLEEEGATTAKFSTSGDAAALDDIYARAIGRARERDPIEGA
jgi:hypothetical protein